MKAIKNLIVIGDRVLISSDDQADRTTSGLYLPLAVKEKEKVMSGYVVKAGLVTLCLICSQKSPGTPAGAGS